MKVILSRKGFDSLWWLFLHITRKKILWKNNEKVEGWAKNLIEKNIESNFEKK